MRFAKSKFHRVKNEVKSRSDSDDGISERIWVACHNKCNIPLASHRDSLRDPCGALAPCFRSFAHAQPAEVRQAQDDIQWYYFSIIFKTRRFMNCTYKRQKRPACGGASNLISILPSILFSLARGALSLLCQNGLLWHPCF